MAITVTLAVDANKFLDTELFGQAPVVDFLETLGFHYAMECASETESGYEYEVAGTPQMELRADTLDRIMEIFPYVELSATNDVDDAYTLTLPISALLEVQVL